MYIPNILYLNLRKKIVSEWLPDSGYQLANAPEIVLHIGLDEKKAINATESCGYLLKK